MENPRHGAALSYDRSQDTKTGLLEAARELFAQKGVSNVSVREIVDRAGQKNKSALQYHFGSIDGLIKELHLRHYQLELDHRAKMAPEIFPKGKPPTVRGVATLIVRSCITLLQISPAYRQWMSVFGHEFAGQGVDGIRESGIDNSSDLEHITSNLLKASPDVDQDILFVRMDQVSRFLGLQLFVLANDDDRLHGPLADVSSAMLVDAVCGLIQAEVSKETKRSLKALRHDWRNLGK